jgi:hypothetical protein
MQEQQRNCSRLQKPKIANAVSDFCRWYVDMAVGRYEVQYRLTVDDNYFDPDSHARLHHLQQDANEQNASAWNGSIESTPIHVERRTI